MSDDGLLSQDDIDALTAGLFGGDDGGGSDDGGGGSGGGGDSIDPELVRPLFKIINTQASSVVTTALNKNVDFKIENLRDVTQTSVEGEFSSDCLIVNVNFDGDLNGSLHFIVSKKNTAIMSDLMMMGDGSAEFEEDHKEALSELMNQIMGSVNTQIATEYELNVSISQSETLDYDSNNLPFEFDNAVQCEVDFKIEEVTDSHVLFIADGKLASSFLQNAEGNAADTFVDEPLVSEESSLNEAADITADVGGDLTSTSNLTGGTLFDSTGNKALDMLLDIPLNITIELGKTQMSIRRILEMGPGSVIEMDRFAGEPVDLLVNNKVIARGEIVVVDENFGIRVVSLVTPEERLKFLQ